MGLVPQKAGVPPAHGQKCLATATRTLRQNRGLLVCGRPKTIQSTENNCRFCDRMFVYCNMARTLPLSPRPAAFSGSRTVIPHRPKWFQCAAATGISCIERLLTTTLRCHWRNLSDLQVTPDDPRVIFCIWHNRLAFSMIVHRKFPRPLTALVSASKDGAMLAAVLNAFGVNQVRGSTSRRGPQALLELTKRAARGCDLAVTPDGPKGPRYVVQKGIISLAQVTGLSIVPVTCNTSRKITLNSWDGFQIPLPFARCEFILHKPIAVARKAGEAERENLREQLQTTLRAGTHD